MPKTIMNKAVFINTLYAPHEKGGAERSVKAIAEEHTRNGGQSVVITLSPNKKQTTDVLNGVKIYYVPVFNVPSYLFFGHGGLFKKILWKLIDLYNPVMAWRVYLILKSERPCVVETNNLQGFSVSIWNVAKSLKIPVVHVARDYYLNCHNSCMYKNEKSCDQQCTSCKVFSFGKKMVSSNVLGFCGVSHKVLDIYNKAGYFPKRLAENVVYSAVKSSSKSIQKIEDQSKKPSLLRVGFIGRHENIKGIETLLNAAKNISQEDFKFLIAGGGDDIYSQGLREKYKQQNIQFLGHKKPEEFYPNIDVLVVPSLWEEPFGRIIAESYTYGIPVIVSDKGGMQEVVEDGVTGLIFKAGDVQSLIEALKKAQRPNVFADTDYLQNCSHNFSSHNVYLRHLDVWNKAK